MPSIRSALRQAMLEARRKSGPIGPPLAKASPGSFSAVSRVATFDQRLSVTAFRMLAALAAYTNRSSLAWPSQELLAVKLGIGRRTAQRALMELEDLGYVTVERRRRTDGRGGKAPNCYALTYPDCPPEGQGEADFWEAAPLPAEPCPI